MLEQPTMFSVRYFHGPRLVLFDLTALGFALNMLGMPRHLGRLGCESSFPYANMWVVALDTRLLGEGRLHGPAEFNQLLSFFARLTDEPAVDFVEKPIAAVPEAKMVLAERHVDSRFNFDNEAVISYVWHPLRTVDRIEFWLGASKVWLDQWKRVPLGKESFRLATGWAEANSKRYLQQITKRRERKHNAVVRNLVPEDRLLDHKLGTGCKPSVRFIDQSTPAVPSPRAPERIMAESMIRHAIWRQATQILLDLALYAFLGNLMVFGAGSLVISLAN